MSASDYITLHLLSSSLFPFSLKAIREGLSLAKKVDQCKDAMRARSGGGDEASWEFGSFCLHSEPSADRISPYSFSALADGYVNLQLLFSSRFPSSLKAIRGG